MLAVVRQSSSSWSLHFARGRATYFQNEKRSLVPRFVRRFFLRYPLAPYYAAIGLCASAFLFPVCHSFYKYLTMSQQEFKNYCAERNSLSSERQRMGTNLWFPFMGVSFDERRRDEIAALPKAD